jgi:hypothetical protein
MVMSRCAFTRPVRNSICASILPLPLRRPCTASSIDTCSRRRAASFTAKLGLTLKCCAVSLCECPASTNLTTRFLRSEGQFLPMLHRYPWSI